MKRLFKLAFAILLFTPTLTSAETQQRFHFEYAPTVFLYDRDNHTINEFQTLDSDYRISYDNQKNFEITLHPRVRIDFEDSSRNRYLPLDAYLSFYGESVDFRMGLQRITWGNGGIFNPTDVINRPDLEGNYFIREKLADPIVSLAWSTDRISGLNEMGFELVTVPYFWQTPLPDNDSRFALAGEQNSISYNLLGNQEAPSYFKSIGYGLRFYLSADAIDFDMIYYHGPDRSPGFALEVDSNGALRLAPFAYNIDLIGTNFSWVAGDWKLRATSAYKITAWNDSRPHDIQPVANDAIPENSWHYAAAIDYTLPKTGNQNLIMTLEYMGVLQDQNGYFNPNAFQNDLLFGVQYSHEGARQVQAMAGVIKDLGSKEWLTLSETSMHIAHGIRFGAQFFTIHKSDGSAFDLFDNNSFVKTYLSYTWGQTTN